ncbi:MAG: P-type ATPase, partial [Thermoanaerobaculia bacterium]
MTRTKPTSLLDRAILSRAAVDAFAKLNPARMMKNPVMFIVEVGALATTLFLLPGLSPKGLFGFQLQIVFWLWATVFFANFAEAVAEGRGKAQADALRRARTETVARRLVGKGKAQREERVPSTQLRKKDRVVVEANEMIPGDGTVVEGIASVNESAITGESAPVIREAGGDRSA